MRHAAARTFLLLAALSTGVLSARAEAPPSVDPAAARTDVVELAKEYIASAPPEKAALEGALRGFDGPIAPVIEAIIASRETQWTAETGAIRDDHFKAPGIREKYKEDILCFFVPETYDTTKPFGLLIFMHGGNQQVGTEYAWHVLSTPEEDRYSYRFRPYIQDVDFITVAPSARCKGKPVRWNQPEIGDYLDAVIAECEYRYSIDRDRVFLGGQSLGGFGSYQWCPRFSDKIAGGVLCAGSWRVINWRCMIGTPLFIVHGLHDSQPGGRPRYTDVFFARSAHKLLEEAGAEHVYAEHSGVHGLAAAGESLARLADWARDRRRDPFFPHVVALTPRGWNSPGEPPSPHNRWVTVLDVGEGQIAYDSVKFTGPGMKWGEPVEDWHKQEWELTKTMVTGGLVEARYDGGNVFDVTTQNVRRFSLWLHPRMVDFSKPVVVAVNGERETHEVVPSLLDALRSYERRNDWGLVYHCELVIEVNS